MAITDFWPGITSILILFYLSYCFIGDEWPYRLAADIGIAAQMGIEVITNINRVIILSFGKIAAGDVILIIPVILGIIYYSIEFPRYSWLSRYPAVLLVGVGMGYCIVTYPVADILSMIVSAWQQVASYGMSINTIVVITCFLTTLWYFVYSVPHRGPGPTPLILDSLANIGKGTALAFLGSKMIACGMLECIGLPASVNIILREWLGVGVAAQPLV
jgi:hypothetical protein